MGAITPIEGNFPIPLNFIPPGMKFTARIYSDAPDAQGVRIEERVVDNQLVLQTAIPPNGGMAIRMTPTDQQALGRWGAAKEGDLTL